MAKLDEKTRSQIITALCEGNSQRATARICEVEQNTVASYLADAGDMAIELLHTQVRDLKVRLIQADELHSFVGAKATTIQKMTAPTDKFGTIWCYLAVCADTKLIFSHHLGSRKIGDAEHFMQDVASRLARSGSGDFAVRPTIVTDGLTVYEEAINNAFGSACDYGIYRKLYTTVGKTGRKLKYERLVGIERIPKIGSPLESDINTAYVERQNLNVRMFNRRYTRKSNGFSKTLEAHKRQLALTLVYHNYCRMLRPLKREIDCADNPGRKRSVWVKRLTPAMEAGLTDFRWEALDLVRLIEEFKSEARAKAREEKSRARRDRKARDLAERLGDVALPFWVYESTLHHTTKVHAAHCVNCNNGKGKGMKGDTKSGRWIGYASLEEGRVGAESRQPDRHSICHMCLGSYRLRGY